MLPSPRIGLILPIIARPVGRRAFAIPHVTASGDVWKIVSGSAGFCIFQSRRFAPRRRRAGWCNDVTVATRAAGFAKQLECGPRPKRGFASQLSVESRSLPTYFRCILSRKEYEVCYIELVSAAHTTELTINLPMLVGFLQSASQAVRCGFCSRDAYLRGSSTQAETVFNAPLATMAHVFEAFTHNQRIVGKSGGRRLVRRQASLAQAFHVDQIRFGSMPATVVDKY